MIFKNFKTKKKSVTGDLFLMETLDNVFLFGLVSNVLDKENRFFRSEQPIEYIYYNFNIDGVLDDDLKKENIITLGPRVLDLQRFGYAKFVKNINIDNTIVFPKVYTVSYSLRFKTEELVDEYRELLSKEDIKYMKEKNIRTYGFGVSNFYGFSALMEESLDIQEENILEKQNDQENDRDLKVGDVIKFRALGKSIFGRVLKLSRIDSISKVKEIPIIEIYSYGGENFHQSMKGNVRYSHLLIHPDLKKKGYLQIITNELASIDPKKEYLFKKEFSYVLRTEIVNEYGNIKETHLGDTQEKYRVFWKNKPEGVDFPVYWVNGENGLSKKIADMLKDIQDDRGFSPNLKEEESEEDLIFDQEDSALDWIGEFGESKDKVKMIEQTIQKVNSVENASFLDASICAEGLAAAAVIGYYLGKYKSIPEHLGELHLKESLAPETVAVFREPAVNLIERILEDSELKDLWEENEEEYPKWRRQVEDLANILRENSK